jgi:membrane fusion protein YbhG
LTANVQVDGAKQQYEAAAASVTVAQTRLDALQAGPLPEAIAVAAAQVRQTESALAALRAQLAKLTLTAPADGVVLTRMSEPGEVAVPGATLLTIGRLDALSLTIYVPENRYGQIQLGQSAQFAVDSFPGQPFGATVTRIANQAAFTPRNVQTAEGRATTVYAVKLSVQNPDNKLKPGMPADVTFGP